MKWIILIVVVIAVLFLVRKFLADRG